MNLHTKKGFNCFGLFLKCFERLALGQGFDKIVCDRQVLSGQKGAKGLRRMTAFLEDNA